MEGLVHVAQTILSARYRDEYQPTVRLLQANGWKIADLRARAKTVSVKASKRGWSLDGKWYKHAWRLSLDNGGRQVMIARDIDTVIRLTDNTAAWLEPGVSILRNSGFKDVYCVPEKAMVCSPYPPDGLHMSYREPGSENAPRIASLELASWGWVFKLSQFSQSWHVPLTAKHVLNGGIKLRGLCSIKDGHIVSTEIQRPGIEPYAYVSWNGCENFMWVIDGMKVLLAVDSPVRLEQWVVSTPISLLPRHVRAVGGLLKKTVSPS